MSHHHAVAAHIHAGTSRDSPEPPWSGYDTLPSSHPAPCASYRTTPTMTSHHRIATTILTLLTANLASTGQDHHHQRPSLPEAEHQPPAQAAAALVANGRRVHGPAEAPTAASATTSTNHHQHTAQHAATTLQLSAPSEGCHNARELSRRHARSPRDALTRQSRPAPAPHERGRSRPAAAGCGQALPDRARRRQLGSLPVAARGRRGRG